MSAHHTVGVELTANQALQLLCMVARLHGVAVDAASLAHQLAFTDNASADFDFLQLAAQKLNLKARVETVALNRLRYTPLPAITQFHDGSWVMVAAANDSQVLVQRAPVAAAPVSVPAAVQDDLPVRMSLSDFAQAWLGWDSESSPKPQGPMLLIASRASLVGDIGSHDELLAKKSLYARLWGMQSGGELREVLT